MHLPDGPPSFPLSGLATQRDAKAWATNEHHRTLACPDLHVPKDPFEVFETISHIDDLADIIQALSREWVLIPGVAGFDAQP